MNELKVGNEILINIKRVGINGEGIGYYKRLAIFVNGALPKEDVVVTITKVFPKYAVAELVRVKKKSPDRIQSECPFDGICGGCQLQHAKYEEELKFKEEYVLESFNKYYSNDLDQKVFKPIVKSNQLNGYRSKVKLPVRYDGENLVTGLYAEGTNNLVYIPKCLVEDEALRKVCDEVLKYLTKYQVIAFNPKAKDGVLRHIVLRKSNYQNSYLVTLILYKEDERTIKIAKGLTEISQIDSIYVSINSDLEGLENISNNTILVAGKPCIVEKMNELSFELYPASFFPINVKQAENEYKLVIDAGKLNKEYSVVDAFSGSGAIGLMAASKVKEVKGIDIDKLQVKAAINNSKINNLPNAYFYTGDVTKVLSKWHQDEKYNPDVLFVNPSRNGLDLKLIDYLRSVKVKRIVYLSNNPSTLAKNCDHLSKVYKIESIQPIDMYPRSFNVDVIVSLVRK